MQPLIPIITFYAINIWPCLHGTIEVGWRIQCLDGSDDVMWGNTKNNASLKLLLQDIKRTYGPKEVIDLRKATWELGNAKINDCGTSV